MLIKEAFKIAQQQLQLNSPTPSLDAKLLLCKALSVNHEQLILLLDNPFPENKLSIFRQFIERRIKSEPIAYIIGKQEFYGLDFLVNQHVLIPRPETEMIIDLVIDLLRDTPGANILDLGTGSGIIPICLAKNLPDCKKIIATDISTEALKIASENALIHNVSDKITFLQSDWFENINLQKFDIITSNPPYISREEVKIVSHSANFYEPHLALYAKCDGLENYYVIAAKAAQYLKKGGKIILEIGYKQAKQVTEIFMSADFHDIKLIEDYSGHPRNLIISY
ncbi:MAG: peptide chain release factor N(5)-glutamine methyltransferase [Rickettsiaceae bacterium]|nr:peptide chain release factor N(5)-glutamine methyltransferase [Rickettsiaceae bacterium]